ncbi:P-type DNA transfer ATPase VirB11 [Novosphingobium naphthalenivorans]|uniref:P-type DNA transfer ATPase VirB11 n=1 Tax=Novosphingobium naphthalenivorans TaxID=273168 RepID=UPI000A3ECD63|nr:P-type DNA transfer ATPase VirB11 [Novosphingobium naphthalenivorans]
MLASDVYLGSYLEPLAPFLTRTDVTDIYVNRPGEVWIEAIGGVPERIEAPNLTARSLARLARQIAAMNAQGISREHPLLSGSLPDGSRVQIVLPPATRGHMALAVRRHVSAGLSLQDYHDAGAFAETQSDHARQDDAGQFETGGENVTDILRQAVQGRRNILISGGTSTGKTTFLNALLREVPATERLILIEDTAELQLSHENTVGLLAARGSLGEADVSAEDLLIASLRMRPDRIILGEMRGKEAMTFLRAVNTGHPGSMSTIHADTPERAIDQLALLVLQAGANMKWDDVVRYVMRSVDLIVQLKRENGRRKVDRVWRPA